MNWSRPATSDARPRVTAAPRDVATLVDRVAARCQCWVRTSLGRANTGKVLTSRRHQRVAWERTHVDSDAGGPGSLHPVTAGRPAGHAPAELRLPAPVWARDTDGRLVFVNSAYAHAVEAKDAGDAVARELELLDRASRNEVMQARAQEAVYSGRLPAVSKGERRIFDVIDSPSAGGSAGIAIDRTEAETMRAELGRMIEAHRRVLDQLATGVAVFNVDRKLTFYNNAFRYFHMGYASALAWILLVMILLATFALFRVSRNRVHYEGEP